MYYYMSVCVCSVMCDSLRTQGLQPAEENDCNECVWLGHTASVMHWSL